ncbi:hypothetical protein EI94DRAFT_1809898 [Lactarius quietus]|nr:hypothetical protein EI94DRAFT_1809898 [Lactarius quietus]
MATIDLSAQPEQTRKTRGGRKKGSKVDSIPSKSVEGELLPPGQATVPVAPKKRGRKPKQLAEAVDNLPSQEDAIGGDPGAAGQPAGDTVDGTGAMAKTAVPAWDPLPPQKEAAAQCECKRLEIEEKLHEAEELQHILACMELEDEKDGIPLAIMESKHEEFEELFDIEDTEDEDINEDQNRDRDKDKDQDQELEDGANEDEDTGKAKGKAKRKSRKVAKTVLCKEIEAKATVLRGGGKKNVESREDGMVKFLPTDILPKKYKKAGVTNTKKAMGYSIDNKDVIRDPAQAAKTQKQRKCLHEHWKNCHDYPEAHTWESRAEEDIEEEEAVRALVAAEDDSYLNYDEARRVRQFDG